jgi:hypothetical protein
MLWWKFIAHGISTLPYFFKDHIQAITSKLPIVIYIKPIISFCTTTCKEKPKVFVENIPCMKKFGA